MGENRRTRRRCILCGGQETMRILIAEDNNITMMSLILTCENLGHEVAETASDGAEAVRKALECRPDVMLLDIHMPGKSGLDVLREVSAQRKIPCIFITAYSDEELLNEASKLGAAGYITKPFSESQLKAQIRIGLQQLENYENASQEAEKYRQKLEERKLVERAKGILMTYSNLTEPEAMQKLQKKSRDSNRKLAQVAQEIIRAEELLR